MLRKQTEREWGRCVATATGRSQTCAAWLRVAARLTDISETGNGGEDAEVDIGKVAEIMKTLQNFNHLAAILTKQNSQVKRSCRS